MSTDRKTANEGEGNKMERYRDRTKGKRTRVCGQTEEEEEEYCLITLLCGGQTVASYFCLCTIAWFP